MDNQQNFNFFFLFLIKNFFVIVVVVVVDCWLVVVVVVVIVVVVKVTFKFNFLKVVIGNWEIRNGEWKKRAEKSYHQFFFFVFFLLLLQLLLHYLVTICSGEGKFFLYTLILNNEGQRSKAKKWQLHLEKCFYTVVANYKTARWLTEICWTKVSV